MVDITTIEGISVYDYVYAKTPEALKNLFKYLKGHGYDIKATWLDGNSSKEKHEQQGWYKWYASLSAETCQRKAKCGFCNKYISVRGIYVHGRKCEECGKVIYLDYVKGGKVKVTIRLEKDDYFRYNDMIFTIHEYDAETKTFTLYPIPKAKWPGHGPLNRLKEAVKLSEFLIEHKDLWEEDGPYITMRNSKDERVSISKEGGGECHASVVNLYKGKEYDDMFGRLPDPQNFTVVEAWHWTKWKADYEKLAVKLLSAAGISNRFDWYRETDSFNFDRIKNMRRFIVEFTEIDIELFDKALEPFFNGHYKNIHNAFIWHIVQFCGGHCNFSGFYGYDHKENVSRNSYSQMFFDNGELSSSANN